MSYQDHFSGHSRDYATYRPTYPEALFTWLASISPSTDVVLDCGTGNGQGAAALAEHFKSVVATDASAEQLAEAVQKDNIEYRAALAEESGLPDNSVDLVSVFQAAHWFDLDNFYTEVNRVLKPTGVIALIGYNTALTGINAIDETYKTFCFNYLWEKQCWAVNRKIVNESYQSINFPFDEITPPEFFIEVQWNYQDYIAYLNTWSAVKTYIKKFDKNPVNEFVVPKIEKHWENPGEKRLIKFPLVLRVGQV